MPDSNFRRKKVFSEYDAMTDEQLRQILREDAEKTEGEEMDQERLLCIMEVLAKRRKKRHEAKDPHAAWDAFQKYYASREGHALKLAAPTAETKRTRGCVRIWKQAAAVIAAAAVMALCVGKPIMTGASRQEVREVTPVFTRDHFYFSTTEKVEPGYWEPMYDLKFDTMQDALDAYGIKQRFAPTWMPEGFERTEVFVSNDTVQRSFYEAYMRGEEFISISVLDYLPSNPSMRCQGGGLVEIYEVNGVKYYLYRNYSRNNVGWFKDGFECTMGGDVTMEELKKIIDSIEGG